MGKSSDTYLVQGHRGCTGIYPENSIAGFLKALEFGVYALELDIVITADKQLIVSHDPYMNHLLCVNPDGSEITKEEEADKNIYHMPMIEAKSYICGSKNHPSFPSQIAVKHNKPSLKELVNEVRKYCGSNNVPEPFWSIEIKSHKKWDGIYHPEPEEYARIIVDQIQELNLKEFIIIGFDHRLLNSISSIDSGLQLGILNEETNLDLSALISSLTHLPHAYYVNHKLLSKELISECEAKEVELVVWTVNDAEVLDRIISLGVKNIISDYPKMVLDRVLESKLDD